MKKVLALALASAMALGMATTAFAASTQQKGMYSGYQKDTARIGTSVSGVYTDVSTGTEPWAPDGSTESTTGNQTTYTYGKDVVPNAKVDDYINLYNDMFFTAQELVDRGLMGTTSFPGENRSREVLSAQAIRDLKLTIRTSTRGGSQGIDSVTLDNRKGHVKIKYVRELVSVDEVDFELTIYAVLDGRRQDDYSMTIIGTVANEITEVYGDYDSVDTSAGQVAEAMEFNSKIEVDLGNGVTIHTKFFKGKKYYGICTRDPDEQDDVVFKKYPDVDNVVTLKTVGLNSTGDIVKLDTDYSDYYVYDKDMNYLGQSNQMLPYSTKYYLANRKLDVTDDSDVDEADAPEENGGTNPETGGDGGAASNANINPGTGR